MNYTALGAAALGLAVAFGAFGAHGLLGRLDAYQMGLWEKAVFYHFVHALGMLITSVLPKTGVVTLSTTSRVCFLFAVGLLLFCGSLYTLAVTGFRTLGALTPVGGLAWIGAWFWLAGAALRRRSD